MNLYDKMKGLKDAEPKNAQAEPRNGAAKAIDRAAKAGAKAVPEKPLKVVTVEKKDRTPAGAASARGARPAADAPRGNARPRIETVDVNTVKPVPPDAAPAFDEVKNREYTAAVRASVHTIRENYKATSNIDRNALDALMRAFVVCVFEVPMQARFSDENVRRMQRGEPPLREGISLLPLTLRTPEGELSFAAYTSREEAEGRYDAHTSWIRMSGARIAEAVLAGQGLSSLTINAFSEFLQMDRAMLRRSLEHAR